MELLTAIIVGTVAGWVASMVMPREASVVLVLNVILGIAGAVIANLLAGWLFGLHGAISALDPIGFTIALVGAVALLGLANLYRYRRAR